MEIKDYLIFFGPLLVVLVGSILAFAWKALELRHQRYVELKNIRLARLEAIHGDLAIALGSLTFLVEKLLLLCSSSTSESDRRNGLPPLIREFSSPLYVVGSKIEIYEERLAPKLKDVSTELGKVTTAAGAFINLHLEPIVTNERRDAAFVQLSSAIQGLNTPLVNLLENVTADIRAIVEPKPTWIEKLLGR